MEAELSLSVEDDWQLPILLAETLAIQKTLETIVRRFKKRLKQFSEKVIQRDYRERLADCNPSY